MKTILKKNVSILIALTLILSTSFCTYATTDSTYEFDRISIISLNNSSYMLTSKDAKPAILKIEKTDNGIKVFLEKHSSKEYLEIDYNTNKIYSSITGNSIDIVNNSTISYASNNINPYVVGDVVEPITKSISYSEILSLVGITCDQYDVAHAIATIFLAKAGLGPVPTLPSIIFNALIGYQFDKIIDNVKSNAKGGIRLTINKVEVTKHQGGNIVHGYAYQFGGISLY